MYPVLNRMSNCISINSLWETSRKKLIISTVIPCYSIIKITFGCLPVNNVLSFCCYAETYPNQTFKQKTVRLPKCHSRLFRYFILVRLYKYILTSPNLVNKVYKVYKVENMIGFAVYLKRRLFKSNMDFMQKNFINFIK